MCRPVLACLVTLLGLLTGGASAPLAAETDRGPRLRAKTLDLVITDDRLNGELRDVPLKSLLEELSQKRGFRYQLPEADADFRVSRKFQDIPTAEALKQILEPFHYILITDAGGAIEELLVQERKDAAPSPPGASAIATPSRYPPGGIVAQPLPDFEPVSNATGPVDPQAEEAPPLPDPTAAWNTTGPPVDEETARRSRPLPAFPPPGP